MVNTTTTLDRPRGAAASGQKVRILLVDDQPANLLALEAILGDLDAELVKAASGDEALRQLLAHDFAVVLLDVQMHGLDGFETAKLIRGREKSRRTPIIFLTAYDSNRLPVDQAYALGAVDYLVKPIVPVILRAKVTGFVELFEKTEQARRQAEQIRQMERREFERKLAEENVRRGESEARQAAILETALDAIISMDHEGNVLEFNPAAERMFGYSREQALGRQLAELIIPPALRDQHRRGMSHYLVTGESRVLNQRLELSAVRADGAVFPVELAVTRIPTAGTPVFTAYVRDITERKRTENRRNARLAVTQVLAQTSTIQDAAPNVLQPICESLAWDVGILWTIDAPAQVLRCAAIWQQPSVEISEFLRASRHRTMAMGEGLPGRVWQSRQSVWIPDVSLEDNFPRAPVARAEGLHGAFGCPIVHGSQVLGVIEFFSGQVREPDLDLLEMMMSIGGQIGQFLERRRVDDARRETEQRFARFMQHLPGLAWIKDPGGRYVFANDAAEKAFGVPRDQLYGKTDGEVFPPETAAQFTQNDRQALASGHGVQVIERLQHQDSAVHYSLVSKFPILAPDGNVALVGGMAIDITDRLRAEEALKEADRRKDQFLAVLAHELRNPLAPIRNALEIMKLAGDDTATLGEAREMMERQVYQMVRLIDDLLDVSRISRGKIELRKETVELTAVVQSAVETTRPAMEALGHTLTVTLPDEPIALEADPLRLAQVLSNLLNNAAKYTEKNGTIKLAIQRDGPAAVVRVSDNGVGIPAEMLPHIFEMFTQVDRSLGRAQGGLGIGLNLVKSLVELHGGSVEAHSSGLGQGSEFVVRLPLPREARREGLPRSPVENHAMLATARRILVVDDNRDAAESLGMVLKLMGHDVRLAHNGTAALMAARAHPPDVAFLDIGMPGMDGYELAKKIRHEPSLRHTLLVALSGWGQDTDRRRGQEAGFDHHIVKPVEPDAVHQLLTQSAASKS